MLAVRTGAHDGFGRLVFDWRAPVGVRVDETGGTATIRFDRAARVDLARLRAALPAPITGVAPVPGKSLALALAVPEGARLRHFTSGTSVVLDVLARRRNLSPPKRRARRQGGSAAGRKAAPPPAAKAAPPLAAKAAPPPPPSPHRPRLPSRRPRACFP